VDRPTGSARVPSEQDVERCLNGAAVLEQADGEVEVDVPPFGELGSPAPAVAGREQAAVAPAHDAPILADPTRSLTGRLHSSLLGLSAGPTLGDAAAIRTFTRAESLRRYGASQVAMSQLRRGARAGDVPARGQPCQRRLRRAAAPDRHGRRRVGFEAAGRDGDAVVIGALAVPLDWAREHGIVVTRLELDGRAVVVAS